MISMIVRCRVSAYGVLSELTRLGSLCADIIYPTHSQPPVSLSLSD